MEIFIPSRPRSFSFFLIKAGLFLFSFQFSFPCPSNEKPPQAKFPLFLRDLSGVKSESWVLASPPLVITVMQIQVDNHSYRLTGAVSINLGADSSLKIDLRNDWEWL